MAALDLTWKSELLGIRVDGNAIGIPFFNKWYNITAERIADRKENRPHHSVSVILCKYLLLCPEIPGKEKDLVTYKVYRDGAPYVLGFRNTAEKPISRAYRNRNLLLTQCITRFELCAK